jgi:transposase
MSISEPMHMSKAVAGPARRIEVSTGSGRRRSWSAEEKALIVAESYAESDTVCGVARRHGLTPQQLFSWRRQARQPVAAMVEVVPPLFVPAVVEAAPDSAQPSSQPKRTRKAGRAVGLIEVEFDGVTVRVGRGADVKTIVAVIRALKAGA